jgi:hypothetical protein
VHEYYYEMTDAMYLTYSTIACMYVWYMSQSAKAEGIYIVRIGSRLANQMCYTSISFETEYALVLAILAILLEYSII